MFRFNTVGRIVHGRGCLRELGGQVRQLGGKRVMLLVDPAIAAGGFLDGLTRAVEDGAQLVGVVDGIAPEPDTGAVEAIADRARRCRPDAIVGVGGGSVLDVAKVISVLMTNDGPAERYFGIGQVPAPGLPLVLVPTTAGTGSEVTSIAVLGDPRDNVKKGIVSDRLFARMVLLDPELTVSLPPSVTAATGLDALVHAVESFTGRQATPFSDAVNQAAIGMVAANLRTACADGSDIGAREAMLYASCLAGMGFSNTQTGLVHAIGMTAGGLYHLRHGVIVAAVCPWVFAFNAESAPAKFARIAEAFGEPVAGLAPAAAAAAGVRAVRRLVEDLGIDCRLSTYGVERETLPLIARTVVATRRFMDNNPRDAREEEVLALLEDNY
jgi:alcohol dehydrogenase class IV